MLPSEIAYTMRPYSGTSDLAKLQTFTAQNTNQASDCGQVHIGDIPHRIYNGLRKFDPAKVVQLWEDTNGNVLGWALLWPSKAKAFEFYVRPDLWNTDLPLQIVTWAEIHLVALLSDNDPQAEIITVYADAMDCDTARQQLLHSCGYSFDSHFWSCTTRSLELPVHEYKLPEGYTIRTAAGDHEANQLAAVHRGAFNSTWTEDEYRTLMHTPGYNPENEMVVVAPDGTFAAFTIIWIDWVNKTMLFEPVGTHVDFQRKGFARALMSAAMQRMKSEGIKTAVVVHEADNSAASSLYASVGFEPKHKINFYTKQIHVRENG